MSNTLLASRRNQDLSHTLPLLFHALTLYFLNDFWGEGEKGETRKTTVMQTVVTVDPGVCSEHEVLR